MSPVISNIKHDLSWPIRNNLNFDLFFPRFYDKKHQVFLQMLKNQMEYRDIMKD